MNTPSSTRALGGLLALAAALCSPLAARAQGFAAYLSPPRFELAIKPGQTLRQVVEITHAGSSPGTYRVYTNDWTYQADGSVVFADALAPDSCRPWVALERRELRLEPGARHRFRFEVAAPADAPVRECRLALMVESLEHTQGAFKAGGRIGVIVYAAVGGAAPQLTLRSVAVREQAGHTEPVVEVHNTGNAHGRLDGIVNGTDAGGQRIEFAPADQPILPGETRRIALRPVTTDSTAKPPVVRYPLELKGELEWGRERMPVQARLAP